MVSADTFKSEAPGAPDFRIDPDDLDDGMPAPGTAMPLLDVVERMVVVSSNEATNMVVELLGRDAANAALPADAGAASSSFGRKYSDFAAAKALGGSHRTTAGDLAALMSAIVTGALVGPAWTAWMTEMLGRQTDRQLTAHVPEGRAVWVEIRGGSTGSVTTLPSSAEPRTRCAASFTVTRGTEEADAEEALGAIGSLALSFPPQPEPAASLAGTGRWLPSRR